MTDLYPLHTTAAGIYDYQSSFELEYHQASARAVRAETERDSAQQLVGELLADLVERWAYEHGYADVPTGEAMVSICEDLAKDWAHGVKVDELNPGPAVIDWVERR